MRLLVHPHKTLFHQVPHPPQEQISQNTFETGWRVRIENVDHAALTDIATRVKMQERGAVENVALHRKHTLVHVHVHDFSLLLALPKGPGFGRDFSKVGSVVPLGAELCRRLRYITPAPVYFLLLRRRGELRR